jgi:hypothetical protein
MDDLGIAKAWILLLAKNPPFLKLKTFMFIDLEIPY